MVSVLKGKLLIVDDDEDVQKAMKRAAEAAGFVVLQEFDGLQVWKVARSELPDVILLDVNMPQTDGRDVLKQLKGDPITATIPVIICSSRAEQHDRHVGLQLGAEDFVEKPCLPHLLIPKITQVMDRSRARRGDD